LGKVVVVGAGIVGLSTARAARARGHEVVLIDKGAIPNREGASWDSHRMIRHHYGDAIGYTRMVGDAFAAWDRVWADLGETHFIDTGAIAIAEREGDFAHRTLAAFRALDLPHAVLDHAEVARLCPQYRLAPTAFGVTGGRGGPLFADRIVAGLADHIAAAGATLLPDCPVVSIDSAAASVTLADGRTIAGDVLVVAAGAWGGRLWPTFAELPVMRQALLYLDPPAAYAQAWRDGPALVAYGDHGGYSLPGVGGTDLKFGHGGHRRPCDPDTGLGSGEGEAEAILAGFAPYVHDIAAYVPLRIRVGYYVMDASRRFRVEGDGRTVAVGNCDGQMFKFGPLVGERILAAIEGEMTMTDLRRWAAGQ
jgi:glycine/D-amino acid oxidase-like deaminating enzyme